MKRVLALVDGSIYSASVCGHAAWAAQRLDAEVRLAHVIGRREPAATGVLGARSALQAELAALDAQRARLVESRGQAILEDASALVRADLLRAGRAAEVSAELVHGDLLAALTAREAQADLVLIGKRGEAADYAIGHLGSNLERIARAARRPVLVASRAFRPIARVLVAHDGGSSALAMVDRIARSPLFAGLSVTLVHVGPRGTELDKRLADAEAVLRAGGLAGGLRVLSGTPDAVLGRLVEEEGFDMLVMGAYGHSRLRSLLIGSTTAAMIHSCKVPVLLQH